MNDDSTKRQITWDDDGTERTSRTRVKKALAIIAAIIVALVSAVPVASFEMSPSSHAAEIQALDEKAETVTGLVTVATATSAAITLLPGDVGTPIAEKLADVSTDFLIVLAAIYLEKYLLSILGLTAFRVLVPAACAFFIAWVVVRKPWRRTLFNIALRLFLFGIVIAVVVPASIVVSNMIESTYASDVDAMVAEATMKDDTVASSGTALPSTPSEATAESGSAVASTDTEATDTTATEEAGDQNVITVFVDWITNLATDAANAATAAGSTLTSGVNDTIDIAKKALNNLIESLAVMIVINCVIPILVLIFFVWFANLIFGSAIRLPEHRVFRDGSSASAHMSGR